MSADKPRVRVFTELDAILDTRYGLLRKHYPKVVEQMPLQAYTHRLIDEFPGVPYHEFKQRYDARGDDALEHAVVTNAAVIIRNVVQGAYRDSIDLPITGKPIVTVNLHPYKFTESEREILLTNLRVNYGPYADVSLVDLALSEITPMYLRGNIQYMVLYNMSEWLGHHNGALEKTRVPGRPIMCPALFQGQIRTVEEMTIEGQSVDIFEVTSKAMACILTVDFVEVEAFSVYSPDYANKLKEGAKFQRADGEKIAHAEVRDDDLERALRGL